MATSIDFARKVGVLFVSVLLAWLAMGVGPQPALAASVLYAAPTAQGAGNCSSWENACTLQTALAQASSGDEIWVKAGVHTPGSAREHTFLLKDGVAVYGGFDGTETERDARDWRGNCTILSGDIGGDDGNDDGNFIAETTGDIRGENSYHVVTASETDDTAVLDGFVITAGQADSNSYPDFYGGGMLIQDGDPTLRNLIFRGNFAGKLGGGMYTSDSSAPALSNVTFQGNQAALGGGGMANHHAAPILEDVSFVGNKVSHPFVLVPGGGMYNDSSAPVLARVVFRNNVASGGGGGMYNVSSSPSLTNVLFFANRASSGAGMYNQDNSEPYLVNVTFHRNQADNQGGGIFSGLSQPVLHNVILWGNSAEEGKEIYSTSPLGKVAYSNIEGGYSGEGNIDADPLFVDGANGDLRLGEGSPAIDAGNNKVVSASTDLDGNPRVQDGNRDNEAIVDMGAYEAPPDENEPEVVSITAADPNPTNAEQIRFQVTFSEPVTRVDATDFELETDSLDGASIGTVSGGPAITYYVTVSTGEGEGRLRLDIPQSATIEDLAANPLTALPYEGGETYVIDRTSPTVASVARLDPTPTSAIQVRYKVVFSEEVVGVDKDDFSLTTTLTEAEVLGVRKENDPPYTYTVTVDTGIGNGTLRLDIPATATITDLATNPLAGVPFEGGEEYAVHKPAPNLLAPANGATLPNRRPFFDWRSFPGASSYVIQIARKDDFTLGLMSSMAIPSEYGLPLDLLPKTTYYWRVRAKVGATYTAWSEVWSFTTGNPPSIPTLLTPASDALVGTQPTLDWANVTVPAGTTFDKYEIQIATDAAFTAPMTAYLSGVTASQYTPVEPLARATRYYWRVRAWNTAGEYSAWSPVWTVRVRYDAPVLQEPECGATNLQPTFRWSSVAGATGYTLQVSRDEAFTLLVINGAVVGTAYNHPTNLAPATYYWRVRANGVFGPGEWSEVWSFTTGNPPSIPTLLTPASDALVGTQPTLDWANVTVPAGTTFDKYEIQIATDAAFTAPMTAYLSGVTASQYTPVEPLARATRYYWRVRAWNTAGEYSAWSPVWTVRVRYTSLTNAQVVVVVTDRKPTFSWDAVGAQADIRQVSSSSTFGTLIINRTQSGTSYTHTALASGTHCWRVRADGAYGPGERFTGRFVIP